MVATSDLFTLFCSGRRRRCLRISHVPADEWKVAPQRGHHANRAITMPDLSSKQTVVCVPTRARPRERTPTRTRTRSHIKISSRDPKGHDMLYIVVRCKRCPGSSVSCLPAPPTQPTPPFLGERGVHPTMATRGCAGRTFHSMEARRREEREIERQYDVLYFGAIARTCARAGHIYTERETRSRLEGKEGEEKKRQGLCGPRLDKVGPYFFLFVKEKKYNQSI